jgi:uncharacterized RDD family membrane protein YckC
VLGLVLLLIASIPQIPEPWVRWGWLGLFFYFGATLLR